MRVMEYHNRVLWFRISLALIVGLTVITACSPRNYFLIDSDMMLKYDRSRQQFMLVWNSSIKHHGVNPDTIPSVLGTHSDTLMVGNSHGLQLIQSQ